MPTTSRGPRLSTKHHRLSRRVVGVGSTRGTLPGPWRVSQPQAGRAAGGQRRASPAGRDGRAASGVCSRPGGEMWNVPDGAVPHGLRGTVSVPGQLGLNHGAPPLGLLWALGIVAPSKCTLRGCHSDHKSSHARRCLLRRGTSNHKHSLLGSRWPPCGHGPQALKQRRPQRPSCRKMEPAGVRVALVTPE